MRPTLAATFDLNMQIRDNPKPISAMRAYLDNNVIATSNGQGYSNRSQLRLLAPTYSQFKGWDSKGIGVPHPARTSTSTYPK